MMSRLAVFVALLLVPAACEPTQLVVDPHDDTCNPPSRVVDDNCIEPGVQDDGCPAGTLGTDGGDCVAAGTPSEMCADGFVHDGDGCEAVLPPEPCGRGLMAVPGDAACREVMPCGAGRWGDLPVDATTQYVDGSYAGGDSDGSEARPWPTIQQGVDAVLPRALVAIAAGSYAAFDIADKAARVWGVCPRLVEVVAQSGIGVIVLASDVEVGGIAITGSGVQDVGVYIDAGATNVVVDRVWLHHLTRDALLSTPGTAFHLRDSLVEFNATGVFSAGSSAILDGVNIRDAVDATFGFGVFSGYAESPASLEMARSLIERHRVNGVFMAGSTARIVGSVVRDQPLYSLPGIPINAAVWAQSGDLPETAHVQSTLELQASTVELSAGYGVYVLDSHVRIDASRVRLAAEGSVLAHLNIFGALSVRRSILEHSGYAGLLLKDSTAEMHGTIVRAIGPRSDGQGGWGIAGWAAATFHPPGVALSGSVITDNSAVGISLRGGAATIDGSVVRATWPQPGGGFGRGIEIAGDNHGNRGSLDLRSSVVADNHDAGVALFSADGTIVGSRIAHTLAVPGQRGDGIMVVSTTQPAFLYVYDVIVEDTAGAAVSSFGAQVALGPSRLRCTPVDFELAANGDYASELVELSAPQCDCPEALDAACVFGTVGGPPLPTPD